jgi:hypothetical protein
MPGSPLLCWVFLSFWVPGYSPWLQGLILRNTLHSEPSSIQNAPLHSYSLITIPPNRLHTSLRHRSQITEGPVLRSFSYTKCPLRSYSLITIPPNRLHTGLRHRSQIMEGPTQALVLYKMTHAFLQLDNHSSKQTTYQPRAQISNHGRACTQVLLLYKMPHAFSRLDNH